MKKKNVVNIHFILTFILRILILLGNKYKNLTIFFSCRCYFAKCL